MYGKVLEEISQVGPSLRLDHSVLLPDLHTKWSIRMDQIILYFSCQRGGNSCRVVKRRAHVQWKRWSWSNLRDVTNVPDHSSKEVLVFFSDNFLLFRPAEYSPSSPQWARSNGVVGAIQKWVGAEPQAKPIRWSNLRDFFYIYIIYNIYMKGPIQKGAFGHEVGNPLHCIGGKMW